jgi:hypothetical protein
MNENLIVRTPIGEIKAVKSHDENYPGIHLHVDGQLVGYLEAELSVGEIRFVQWKKDCDNCEPDIKAIEKCEPCSEVEEDPEQMNMFEMGVTV